jgi:DNA-binding MarR family transcriptional regulator
MPGDESMQRLFLREKPVLALLAVGDMNPAYAAMIAKRIDSTFPHTSNILSQLEEYGMITARPEGRIRYLELTERGKKTSLALSQLMELLQEPKFHQRRLEILRSRVESADGPDRVFKLGPLRRDLSRLESVEDEQLAREAHELDERIKAAIQESKL